MERVKGISKAIPLDDESALWNLRDPTSMNMQQQLNALLASLPSDSDVHDNLKRASEENCLLPALSRYLRSPSLTLVITKAFRPLLVDLCARWIDDVNGSEVVLDTLEALALLIEVHDELFP